MTIPQTGGQSQTAQHVDTQQGAAQQAIARGIVDLANVKDELKGFVTGATDAPNWTALVTRFEATLDRMYQARADLGWSSGGP